MHLRALAALYSPYVDVNEDETGGISISGPAVDVFDVLASRLNFTYSVRTPPDGQWGSKSADGTWSGMIGMLQRQEADIAIGPFTLTYERYEAVQTSVPFYTDTVRILVKEEERTLSIFSFFGVFTWTVWLSILVSTIVVTLVMTIADVIERSQKNIMHAYFQNLWCNSRTFFNQELSYDALGLGKKTLKVFWTASVMVLTIAFSANFLSTLLVPSSAKMNSLEDLAVASGIHPIMERGSSIFSVFRSTPVPIYQEVFRRVMKNEKQLLLTLVDIEKVALDLVRQGPYAVMTDTASLKGFLSDRYRAGLPCNFHLSKEGFLQLWKVMVFSRTFPKKYLSIINQIIRRMTESRWFLPRMEKEYSSYARCTEKSQSDFPALKLTDMEGVFLIFVIGIAVSSTAFIIEILIGHSKKRKLVPEVIHHVESKQRRRWV